jgi:hypothetical protein
MPTINNNSTCDVSTIFNGGGPANAGASVVVGGKQLIPSPFISLVLEKYKVDDLTIGGILKLTLSGTVTGSSFNEVVTTGAGGVTGLKDILQLGQYRECVFVEIKCVDKIVSGYGRITSINIDQGNMPTWVNIAPYTIDIDLYTNDISLASGVRVTTPDIISPSSSPRVHELADLMLNSISEQFSVNINDDTFNYYNLSIIDPQTSTQIGPKYWGNKHLKTSFNISAAGIRGLNECSGVGSGNPITHLKFGLNAAEDYIRQRINNLVDMNIDGLFDAPNTELTPTFASYRTGYKFLDLRSIDINPLENSINLTGEIIYRPSGCGSGISVPSGSIEDRVFTTMTVEENVDTEGNTITLTANIQGLFNNQYDQIIKMSNPTFHGCNFTQKLDHAQAFLNLTSDRYITLLANKYFTQSNLIDDCPLSTSTGVCSSPSPSAPPSSLLCEMRMISKQISRNLSQGEINAIWTLSNKPSCNTIGTTKIDVEITHDKPHNNIVEFIIPGRGSSIIQSLCCDSAEKYDLSINVSKNRNNCNFDMTSGSISGLRACAYQTLEQLKTDAGIDFSCWFKTNDQETIGSNTYKLNQSYTKPSCS